MKKFVALFAAMLILQLSARPAPAGAGGNLPRPADAPGGHRGGVVLALSGGGTKGFAHLGVLKVLEREKIPIAGIVGVSIGSVIGGLYACGYSVDEIHEIVDQTNIMGLLADSGTRLKPDAGDHRPIGEMARLYYRDFDKNFKPSGPLGVLPAVSFASFLTKYTGHIQTTDFGELPIPFACVATDLGTGEEVVMRDGSLASSIRASASIPGLLEPWPIGGRLLVDGGLVANVPVLVAKEIFPGYPVIAVNLAGESIAKANDRFDSVLDVMLQMIDIMTIDRIRANESAADLVLYPDVGMYSMLDPSGYDDIYQRGLDAAEAKVESMIAISASAPLPPPERAGSRSARVVRSVEIRGLNVSHASDIEKNYEHWIGKPYDVEAVNDALGKISRLDEVATVDVDAHPSGEGSADVDVVFSVEKRPAFEIAVDGYTSSMHPHRWIGFSMNARDLSSDGDAANLNVRLGNGEWGADVRYFTPLVRNGQWGFSVRAEKEDLSLLGMEDYTLERYSARAIYYIEKMDGYRLGVGMAGEYADALGAYDRFSWGPYLYFNMDTLDNLLIPSRGYSLNSQIWWNDSDTLVSRTSLTAYVPWKSDLHFMLNLGLDTGSGNNPAYRALLGSKEELFSLARYPLAGDQSAWARIGFGRDFYNSWWGAVRGEVFATYGMIMEDWAMTGDAWETGIALSVPGQLLSGRLILAYSSDDEFVFGFTVGNPTWHPSPLP
ncbi:MAG: patatin-like phospholipase family protein [Synergistaceae bacterium]|nr:patatin-like phospholipase family protein [Synergistaceae bacterium]